MFKNSIINNKFNWPVFCDDNLKVGYLPVPKAANTSILNALFAFQAPADQKKRLDSIPQEIIKVPVDNPARVHLYGRYMFDQMRNKSNVDDFFVFSCVRNPISRFVSFYKDKILRWDPYIEEKLLSLGFERNMGLDECIENLCGIKNPLNLDQHIIPMTALLYHQGKLIPDYLMKVESLEHDWNYFNKMIGMNVFQLISENSSSNRELDNIHLTLKQEKMLRNYYFDDIHLLGYYQ